MKEETCLASPLVTNTERGTNGTDSVVISISCSMNEIPCLGSLARTTNTGRVTIVYVKKGICSLFHLLFRE